MTGVELPIAIGSIPGILALAGGLVGYGRAMQRLTRVEQDVKDLKDVGKEVAVIGERTKNTDDNVRAMRDDVGRITGHLLDEKRTFDVKPPPRR